MINYDRGAASIIMLQHDNDVIDDVAVRGSFGCVCYATWECSHPRLIYLEWIGMRGAKHQEEETQRKHCSDAHELISVIITLSTATAPPNQNMHRSQ